MMSVLHFNIRLGLLK